MNNLQKFTTQAEYEAAEHSYPNVSWITSGDTVIYEKEPKFGGLTAYYDVTDTTNPTNLFYVPSGSGSGSGSAVLPTSMIIDGTEVEVSDSYQFSTLGEHIVQYSFEATAIPNYFFYDRSYVRGCDITKVEIGNSITSIGNEVFKYCDKLTSIDIPSSVTSIGEYAFMYCSGLTSLDIPDSVTTIGEEAMRECYGLTSVTIGSGVTSIGAVAFGNCTSLTSITSNATTAPTLGSYPFAEIKTNGTLYVPIGSTGYDTWMQNVEYYLGFYNWTKVEQ